MLQRDMNVTDEHRYQWYVHVMTAHRDAEQLWGHAGGFDGLVLGMAVGIGRITGEPPTLSQAAEMAGMTRGKARRLVAKLEQAGAIESRRDASGRLRLYSTFGEADGYQEVADTMIQRSWARVKP